MSSTTTKALGIAVLVLAAAGIATLVALLITAKVKCGNAGYLFKGCLSSPVSYASKTGVRYSMPLVWRTGECYFVTLTLGPNHINCVADTGSSALVVSGAGCRGCPTGDGHFSSHLNKHLKTSTLTYGSQTVQAQKHSARLMGIGGAQSATRIIIDVMYAASGTPMNVCGLGQMAPSPGQAKPLLMQLVDNEGIKNCVTFSMGAVNEMTLGDFQMPSAANAVSLPLLQGSSTMPWYHVSPPAGCNFPSGITSIVLDTGTTETLVPANVLSAFKQLSNYQLAPGISWDSASFGSYLNAIPSGELPDGLMILGIEWMRKFSIVQFDSESQLVTFVA